MTKSAVVERKRAVVEECDPEEDLRGLGLPGNPEMEEVLQRQEVLNTQLVEIGSRLEHAHEKLAHLTEMQRTLEVANKELGRLGDLHWQQHIIAPMVQQVFPIFDLAIGLRAAHRAHGGKELEALKAIQSLLEDFLATYDICVVHPRHGEAFNPNLMKAVKVCPTEEKRLDKCVRICVQVGFQWNGGAAIRPASVYVWRQQLVESAALSIRRSRV